MRNKLKWWPQTKSWNVDGAWEVEKWQKTVCGCSGWRLWKIDNIKRNDWKNCGLPYGFDGNVLGLLNVIEINFCEKKCFLVTRFRLRKRHVARIEMEFMGFCTNCKKVEVNQAVLRLWGSFISMYSVKFTSKMVMWFFQTFFYPSLFLMWNQTHNNSKLLMFPNHLPSKLNTPICLFRNLKKSLSQVMLI